MDYGEGKYHDEEMQNLLMDASEREMREIAEAEQADADAAADYENRMAQQEAEDWENREQYGIPW